MSVTFMAWRACCMYDVPDV